MQTPIYFYDPGDENYKDTRRAWLSLKNPPEVPTPSELANSEDLPLRAYDGQKPNANDRFICLIHWTRLNFPTSTITNWANAHPNARFIVISGAGLPTPANTEKNVLYLRQPVGDLSANGGFKSEFHAWYKAWSADTKYLWGQLIGDDEPLLAFRLLCEATKVVEDENTKRTAKDEKTSKTAELSSMTIHAPKDLGAWLAPFGKSKPEEISQVAGMIGSGVVKEAAEKVLNAVNGSGDLPEAITDFLKLNEPQNP